jgi:hypothetical protein
MMLNFYSNFRVRNKLLLLFYFLLIIETLVISKSFLFYADAYYYFAIAKNIVAGLGVTFDGVTPTTGFHPLWLLITYQLYYYFSDFNQFHNVVLILSTTLFISGHFLLYKTALLNGVSSRLFIYVSFLIFFLNISVFQLSGMENVILFPLICLFLWLNYQTIFNKSIANVLISIVLVFTYFARLDSIFLIITYLLYFYWKHYASIKVSTIITHVLVIALPILFHLVFMYIEFGTIYPTSSIAIKEFLSMNENDGLLESFSPNEHILPIRILTLLNFLDVKIPEYLATYIGLIVPLVLVLACVFIIKNRGGSDALSILAISTVVHFFYYALVMNGWFRPWYFTGWYIVVVFGISFAFLNACQRMSITKQKIFYNVFNPVLLLVLMTLVIYFKKINPSYSWHKIYTNSRLLDEYNDPDIVLVGYTPDRSGFFSSANIYHLEGLVNGYKFINDYLITKKIAQYVLDIGATHFVVSNANILPKCMRSYILVAGSGIKKDTIYGILEKRNSYIAVYRILKISQNQNINNTVVECKV